MRDVGSVQLTRSTGVTRSIDDLTTLFDLCLFVVNLRDRATTAGLRPVLERIVDVLGDADCRLGILATGLPGQQARNVLGDLVERVPLFTDPEGEDAIGLGLGGAPALIWITPAGEVAAEVEGWDARAWRRVLGELADELHWARPLVGLPSDPPPAPPRPFRLTTRARAA